MSNSIIICDQYELSNLLTSESNHLWEGLKVHIGLVNNLNHHQTAF